MVQSEYLSKLFHHLPVIVVYYKINLSVH